MNDLFQHEKAVAIAAVREAAQLCQAVQAQIIPEIIKKDKSPVTVADFGSQALVCRMLRARFPHDPIIAEEDATALRQDDQREVMEQVHRRVADLYPEVDQETVLEWIDYGNAQSYSNRFWTLDPIDGTKGFLRKEQYAVALALIVDGEVVVAAIACPNLPGPANHSGGGVYAAIQGMGVERLSLDGEAGTLPIAVSDLQQVSLARFCESVESGHSSHDDAATVAQRLGITAAPIRMDSQAKYAAVAQGEAEIYLRLPTRPGYEEKIWDHAAGSLIVTEAGGTVTDVTGKPLSFRHGPTLKENIGVVVTNGAFHNEVIVVLEEVGVGQVS